MLAEKMTIYTSATTYIDRGWRTQTALSAASMQDPSRNLDLAARKIIINTNIEKENNHLIKQYKGDNDINNYKIVQ